MLTVQQNTAGFVAVPGRDTAPTGLNKTIG